MYFVTFRLTDSIPQPKLEQWRREREEWLRGHPEPWSRADQREYYGLFTEMIEGWLDAGAGSCLLARPENARIVSDALKYFDGQRYRLGAWVVMPNHVHVVFTAIAPHSPTDILRSWKSHTAGAIKRLCGKTGQLWQRESFDHIVRPESQLRAIERHIEENPAKAGIRAAQSRSRVAGEKLPSSQEWIKLPA